MIYCSIDIETTGLDSERYQTLSIGAIIEDTTKKLSFEEIPKFYGIILHREITGSPFAINMNAKNIRLIGEYYEGSLETQEEMSKQYGGIFHDEDQIIKQFYIFLVRNGLLTLPNLDVDTYLRNIHFNSSAKPVTINVAGKNFGTFDKKFLEKLPWYQKLIRTRQRILDPAILCVDWEEDDKLPSLDECKSRTGITGAVTHNALEDAWDVIEVLRKFY